MFDTRSVFGRKDGSRLRPCQGPRNIAATFERKVRAVRQHVSQFGKHPDLEGFLSRLAERHGRGYHVAVAEGFKPLAR